MARSGKPGRKPKFDPEIRRTLVDNPGVWHILWENTKVTDEMKKWQRRGFRFLVRTVNENNKAKYGLPFVPEHPIVLARFIGGPVNDLD